MHVDKVTMRILVYMLLAVAAIFAGSGCTEETKVNVASRLQPGRMPTMSTRNVSTLISDSGVTQYRIVAPYWEVYDEVEEPYWRFPDGIFLRKFDRKFRVISTIAADSAVYFKNKGIWRLDGRVEITKEPKELFLSQQVFWDQNKGIVYGDSFIHIENATHIMEGYGFTAKQDFSEYRILKPLGIFPAEREKMKGDGNSASSAEPSQPSHAARPAHSGRPLQRKELAPPDESMPEMRPVRMDEM